MVNALPYLPNILKGVVSRVDLSLSTRIADPFNVFFDYGIYQQVGRDRPDAAFPLIWLVMNFPEDVGGQPGVFASATVQLIVAMMTKPEYSQQERDDNVFFPRLIPIYDELINQIAREKKFFTPLKNQIKHTRILRPYWGGGDVNGPGTENMFQNYIDAISITNLKLNIKFC